MKLTDLEKIDVKRKKLITLSKSLNSLTDPELIKFSQELDEMIIGYQRKLANKNNL